MTLAIYTTLGQQIQAVIRGLNLDRLPAAQVYWFEFATDRLADGVQLPCVQISLPTEAVSTVFATTEGNSWGFPFLITLGKVANQGNDWDDQFRQWFEQITFAFHDQAPLDITQAYQCRITPRSTVDPNLWRQRNVSVGQMLLMVNYYRIRT